MTRRGFMAALPGLALLATRCTPPLPAAEPVYSCVMKPVAPIVLKAETWTHSIPVGELNIGEMIETLYAIEMFRQSQPGYNPDVIEFYVVEKLENFSGD